jgi:purine-binding chemotaxis protein CheW
LTLLVFHVRGQMAALPLESVERIALMAQLARPPGLPSPLEGILDLGGTAVPVLRLDRLFRLPVHEPDLYSMLIVLKGIGAGGLALLVERASEVRSVSVGDELLPVSREDSFNGCAEASFFLKGQTVSLLSPQRILLEKEKQALSEFQTLTQHRLENWGAANR